jgi:Lysylphosphatidylglycerol synthase TM region
MKIKKSQLFNLIVFIAGLIFIFFLIRGIGWGKTQKYLNLMGYSFLWLFPIYLITLIGDTFSWKLLIRHKVSLIRVMLVANAGTAINAVTWGGDGGEFVKGNLIQEDIGVPESVSSLLLWNFIYAITKKNLMFIGPILYLIFGPFESDPKPISILFAWGFIAAGIITSIHLPVFYVLVKIYGVEKVAKVLHRLPLVRRLDLDKVLSFARKIDEAFNAFGKDHKLRLFLSGLLLFISHVSVCVEIWFVLKVMGMNIHPITSVVLFSGASIIQSIISFSPVEMGVTEAGSYALYKILGYNPVFGLMQEVIRRARRLVFNLLGILYIGYRAFSPDSKDKSKNSDHENSTELEESSEIKEENHV